MLTPSATKLAITPGVVRRMLRISLFTVVVRLMLMHSLPFSLPSPSFTQVEDIGTLSCSFRAGCTEMFLSYLRGSGSVSSDCPLSDSIHSSLAQRGVLATTADVPTHDVYVLVTAMVCIAIKMVMWLRLRRMRRAPDVSVRGVSVLFCGCFDEIYGILYFYHYSYLCRRHCRRHRRCSSSLPLLLLHVMRLCLMFSASQLPPSFMLWRNSKNRRRKRL